MLTKSVIAEHRILYVASSILAFVKVHPLCRPHFPYCSSLTCSSHSTFFPPTLSVANCPSSLGSHSANRARTVHSIDRHVTSFGTRPARSVEYTSRRHWCLIQPATVRLPSIRIDTRAGAARRRARFRRAAAQSRMRGPAPDSTGPSWLTIAERISRTGRMRSAHTPATTRSERRRLGERLRERLRIRTWCLRSTDSATTDRAPPGPASRATVASRCRNRTAKSRTAQSDQDRDFVRNAHEFCNSPRTRSRSRDWQIRMRQDVM
jgi:hypothetical protein